jgi:hypothetical protein
LQQRRPAGQCRESESKRALARARVRPVRSSQLASSNRQWEWVSWARGNGALRLWHMHHPTPQQAGNQTGKQNGGASHAFLWRSLLTLAVDARGWGEANPQARLFPELNSPMHTIALGCRCWGAGRREPGHGGDEPKPRPNTLIGRPIGTRPCTPPVPPY